VSPICGGTFEEEDMDYRFDHPERLDGEVYLGNFTDDVFGQFVPWKTKRLGTKAYDITGKRIGSDIYPGFASISETGFSISPDLKAINDWTQVEGGPVG
jgi:hypothetical protein